MSYCPLCVPEMGITEDGKCVIVRYYPKSEIDQDSLQTRTYELDTGLHIIREGWFNGFDKTEENLITYEIIHPYEDWKIKHMLDNDIIQEEMRVVKQNL